MEPASKRAKTHNFENDEEAEAYVDSLLLGKHELPLEIWVKILSSNPALSVQDIQRMCRVNWQFKELCDTGIVWDEIFKRQFGVETFVKERERKYLTADTISFLKHYMFKKYEKKHQLFRLLTFRVYYLGYEQSPETGYEYATSNWRFYLRHEPDPVFELERHEDFDSLLYDDEPEYDPQYTIRLNGSEHHVAVISGALNVSGLISKDLMMKIRRTRVNVIRRIRFVGYDLVMHDTNILRFMYILLVMGYTLGDRQSVLYTGSLCNSCNNIAEYACGGCQKTYYCSQECVRKDWKRQHYATCSYE